LNLAKRTVSEAADVSSPTTSVAGDAKASPFGAARPIDTAAKEREIEEKRLAALKEKKEAEEKAKEERKEAARAAKAAEAENAGDKKVEILQRGQGEEVKDGETIETENANGEVTDDKAVKPREIVRDMKKPAETGAWRRPSGGPPPPRDDNIPRGPRGGRGGRGGRGPRHYEEGRGGRPYNNERQYSNGGNKSPATPTQATGAEPTAEAVEEDGWSTVSKPKKNNRGGNGGARAIAS
jgi:translation initiation factor 4B